MYFCNFERENIRVEWGFGIPWPCETRGRRVRGSCVLFGPGGLFCVVVIGFVLLRPEPKCRLVKLGKASLPDP
jgi:hypothetical protein